MEPVAADEPLLLIGNNEKRNRESGLYSWRAFVREMKPVIQIALPMIVVTISQLLLRISPMFMLGHLDQLSLSGASIAISISNVTGFSVLFGMASALETLCGQAYGAGQYERVGAYTYGAILCLLLVCLPFSILWIYTEKLLVLIGQDPLISAEAGKYMIRLIPALFPFAILQCLIRYFQTQSLILPMLWISLVSLVFQVVLCWLLVFIFNMGAAGAPFSIGISYWIYVVLLVGYIKYSPFCSKTRNSFSIGVFATIKDFFRFAIPSAVMVCLEWWAVEAIILLSGLLPKPQLETSVLSICLTIASVHYYVPYSFGAAASTVVSNELGAGKPEAAKVALRAVLFVCVAEFMIASLAIFACRSILGYAFSEDKEIVDYFKEMAPFLCLSIIMDGLQSVLSGVVRGTGWQHIGAYINLGAYYLVGIPMSILLGFVFHLMGRGLWTGLVVGSAINALSLSLMTGLTNWQKQATKARERIFVGEVSVENNSI